MFPRPRTFAAAAAAALLALVPASATRATEPAQPHGEIFLTISDAGNTWIRGVLLTCPDQDGPHPRADEACILLDQAGGRMRALPEREQHCTAHHAPVTASATGTWRDVRISWQGKYPSTCALVRKTGAVFDF
ncbi:hypothetical protein GCM10010420_16630 [Streptomyces glaucosporus]|uniref:Subtilisin inhibitor domain-containing protein n=1 Tax=Streptomyces glaucosporus TaxID=284044 RepID=A0ABN3I1E5_9ACTN